MTDRAKHDAMANAIRALSMDAVQAANSGHPGLPMGGADIATVLFSKVMKFDPKAPNWPDRDRFVLSAGHGSMLLYSSLYLLGYEDMTLEDIKHFRQLGYKTAGHPEYGHADGIETTTGPLGQGLGNSVGMAIAEAKLRAEFGEDLVNHHTYVYAGDGCLMEGISQEAISLAGHLKLNKLIVIWDNNDITIDGKVSMADSTDQLKRFEASGWATMDIDGHDPVEIEKALLDAQKSDKPVLISARTTIGFGSPNKAGTNKVHGSPLGDEELAAAKKQLGWEYGPFEVPAEIVENWRAAGQRGGEAREAWNGRLQAAEKREEFERRMRGELPAALKSAMADYKKKLAADKPKKATRASSQDALEVINGAVPETLGGSADLTGSNNTNTSQTLPFTADDYAGRYIHYGIREHGMAAAMNGIALHGGMIPYGGTFMTFTDYCRPSIRLSALMGIRVGYVMTHDSIGLGEDGPTHQPVEHLAALRAIPNLLVFRPADAMEAAECWEITLEREKQPSILALSRQGLPALRTEYTDENLSLRGAYTIWGDADAEVVIFGTGSETQIAVEAAKELTEAGTPARAVSVPSMELFFAQPDDYRQTVFGKARARVAVEAGIEMGWSKFLGETGRFVGMTGFGASGEISDLYTHFGITTKAVVEAAKAQL
ncbi:transketolase [Pelagibacterium sp. H642]|uniref:transketolase n=1 Tax=Pelagibacterium sp. H642 TaxID=1881069 RepID=UPI002815B25C|nr:transketolase [Pelagibacterium sp. H642]WMT89450.1 transketolase [Pelagibacterium sp. H642]